MKIEHSSTGNYNKNNIGLVPIGHLKQQFLEVKFFTPPNV